MQNQLIQSQPVSDQFDFHLSLLVCFVGLYNLSRVKIKLLVADYYTRSTISAVVLWFFLQRDFTKTDISYFDIKFQVKNLYPFQFSSH